MIYIILSIVLIIVLILLTLSLCYVTIDIHLKNQILYIKIGNKLYSKKIQVDLSKPKETKKEKKSDNTSKEDTSSFIDKLKKIKNRVFDAEKGIDYDEVKNIKNEIFDAYSETIDIVKKIFGKLRYKIKVTALRVKLEYGTGNAATTGMLYGGIWQLTGILYPIASSWVKIVYPTLDITPDFYGKRFDIEVQSIIKVRPAHIISASFSPLLSPAITYLKNKKGREKNG